MKKYIALFLCFLTMFSLCSCNIYEQIFSILTSPDGTTSNETTTEPQDPPQTMPQSGWEDTDEAKTTEPFRYYYEIVDAYRVAAKRFDLINETVDTVYKEVGLDNIRQAEIFKQLAQSTRSFYPYDDQNGDAVTFERLNYFCYDDKTDLNGDGAPELVLLTENYDVLAIYSYSRRRVDVYGDRVSYYYHNPLLLATFTPYEGCWIDGEGRIHVNSTTYSQPIVKRHTVYEIAQGGKELNKIVEYDEESAYGSSGMRYYKITDGERIAITQKDFDALNAQYGKYLDRTERAEATREQSGLNAFSLYNFYGREFPEAKFRPVFNGEKQVLVEKTGEYVFLKDYVPAVGGIPLSKCDVLRYVYYDVDDDEIYEAVIDCGIVQFVLTYDNRLVTLKEISNERWQEIENDMSCYIFSICPLSAPWREKLLSREEIHDIASDIWGVSDGYGDGACGTFYTHYIVVADEPDEDGYYLVTWRTEISHHNDFECCPDDGSDYHITSVEDYRYMLVHERTGELWNDATISPPKAQKLACEYWGVADGQVIVGLNKTFVVHAIVEESISLTNDFYCVIMQVEHYEGDAYENGKEAQKVEKLYRIYVHKQDGTVSTSPDYSGK